MKKIEQKLLECFQKRKELKQGADKISIDLETKSTFYYHYECLVFAKIINADDKEIVYFCLPSFEGVLSHTTKSRINTFLSEYGLKVQSKNYKYFCSGTEVKLDTIYFINKDDKEKYFINQK